MRLPRIYWGRVAGWALLVALAVLGALHGTPVVAGVALVAALIGGPGAYAAALRPLGSTSGRREEGGHRRAAWCAARAALVSPASVFAITGVVAMVGPVVVIAAVLVIAAVGWAARGQLAEVWTATVTSRPVHMPMPASTSGSAARSGLAEELERMSNAELGRAWSRSHARLAAARDATELDRLNEVRRCQLDEMERRDPAGFHRWLGSGVWISGDSAPFLQRG